MSQNEPTGPAPVDDQQAPGDDAGPFTIQEPSPASPRPDPARLRSIVLWALRVAREELAAEMRQAGGEGCAPTQLA